MKLDSTGSRQWTYQTGSTAQDSAEVRPKAFFCVAVGLRELRNRNQEHKKGCLDKHNVETVPGYVLELRDRESSPCHKGTHWVGRVWHFISIEDYTWAEKGVPPVITHFF